MDGGDPSSRTQLQDYGQLCVETDTVGFCRGLLRFIDFKEAEQLVVDGIRHGSVFSELVRILAPQPVFLLHLSADPAVRSQRLADRGEASDGFRKASDHAVEAQIEAYLPSIADTLIDTNQSADEVLACALETISALKA